jgi:hypothetical protein
MSINSSWMSFMVRSWSASSLRILQDWVRIEMLVANPFRPSHTSNACFCCRIVARKTIGKSTTLRIQSLKKLIQACAVFKTITTNLPRDINVALRSLGLVVWYWIHLCSQGHLQEKKLVRSVGKSLPQKTSTGFQHWFSKKFLFYSKTGTFVSRRRI